MFVKKESGHNNNKFANHSLDEKLIELIQAHLPNLTPEQEEEDWFHSWVFFCVEAYNAELLDESFKQILLDRIAQKLQDELSQTDLIDYVTFPVLFTDLLMLVDKAVIGLLQPNLNRQTIEIKISEAYREQANIYGDLFKERLTKWYETFTTHWIKEKIEPFHEYQIEPYYKNAFETLWLAYNLGLFTNHCEDSFCESFKDSISSPSETIVINQNNELILCQAFNTYLQDNNLLPKDLASLQKPSQISAILGTNSSVINSHSKTNQHFYKALWAFFIDKELAPGMYRKNSNLMNKQHLDITINPTNAIDSTNKEFLLKLIEINKFQTIRICQNELVLFSYDNKNGVLINSAFVDRIQIERINTLIKLIELETLSKISPAVAFGLYNLGTIDTRFKAARDQLSNSGEIRVESDSRFFQKAGPETENTLANTSECAL